jgi:hypothetical protein
MASLLTRTQIFTFEDDFQLHVVDTSDFAGSVNGTSKRGSLSDYRTYMLAPTLVKAAYESNPDTNALTDENVTKLSNITVTSPIDLDFIDGGVI